MGDKYLVKTNTHMSTCTSSGPLVPTAALQESSSSMATNVNSETESNLRSSQVPFLTGMASSCVFPSAHVQWMTRLSLGSAYAVQIFFEVRCTGFLVYLGSRLWLWPPSPAGTGQWLTSLAKQASCLCSLKLRLSVRLSNSSNHLHNCCLKPWRRQQGDDEPLVFGSGRPGRSTASGFEKDA